MLKHAAEIQGTTLTDFVVSAASEAARSVIDDAGVMRLSIEGQRQVSRLCSTRHRRHLLCVARSSIIALCSVVSHHSWTA